MYKMDRKGSAELLSCDANRSKRASCDSLASDSKSSSLNSKLGQESVSILAVNCLYCVSFTYTHHLQPADCITIISSPSWTQDVSFTTVSILAVGTYRPPTKWTPVPLLHLKNHTVSGLCANLYLLCRWPEVFGGLLTSLFHNVRFISHTARVPAQVLCRIY